MPGLVPLTIIGIVVLAALIVVFLRVRRTDMIGAVLEKRRAGSKIVTRAELVEGVEKLPVALALTGSELLYENPDLEASFELARIDEVEYSDELATGRTLDDGNRVLRLRAHGTLFEFILARGDWERWSQALPPHVRGEAAKAV